MSGTGALPHRIGMAWPDFVNRPTTKATETKPRRLLLRNLRRMAPLHHRVPALLTRRSRVCFTKLTACIPGFQRRPRKGLLIRSPRAQFTGWRKRSWSSVHRSRTALLGSCGDWSAGFGESCKANNLSECIWMVSAALSCCVLGRVLSMTFSDSGTWAGLRLFVLSV